MPAPEAPRPQEPTTERSAARRAAPPPDLSSTPAFLRDRVDAKAAAEAPRSRPRADAAPDELRRPATPEAPQAGAAPLLDPAALPMPSLSRRRLVTAGGILIAGLLALSFARQVGEATAATNRAAELRAANAALRDDVARLERDLDRVQDLRFIRLEGRAFGLGGKGEIPFALEAGAPELPADAPGSASVRLGVEPRPQTPLDAWLEVLFGAGA